MPDTIRNQEIANLDLSQIAALQQKRTLAFVNHFVITTVQFLNNFAKRCEQKMMEFERKIEKINATMVLLEARLSSIPEINTQEETKPKQESNEQPVTNETTDQSDINNDNTDNNNKIVNTDNTPENNSPKHKPEYEKFIKMVQVGVPLDAVKLKIGLEGLDPNELEIILKR